MKTTTTRLTFSCARGACAFAAIAFFFAVPAQGGTLGIVDITASNGTNSSTLHIGVPLLGDWHPGTVVSFGNGLGSVSELTLATDYDPAVSLGFFVTAGGSTTTFTISSPVVSFGALSNQQGVASAGVTLTDNDGDGATSNGMFPANKAYESVYNGGTVFRDLVTPVNAPPNSTWTTSEQYPPSGTIAIPGSVSSIQSQFSFNLSANDSASGTSIFRVVPEPSSMILALLGAAALLWRVRRRFV